MKVRGLKQVLHWIFLVVGIFSLIMLCITVNTYLGYAEEGYGLKMSFDEAWLHDDWIVMRFYIENPGKLDIDLVEGNLTLNQTYNIPNMILPNGIAQERPLTPLLAGENTSIVIWVPITDPADLGNIQALHEVEIDLDLLIWVPERYMNTHITYQATVGVTV